MPDEKKIIKYETPESWKVSVTYPIGKGKIEMSLGGHTETQDEAQKRFDNAIEKFSEDISKVREKMNKK